MDDEVSVGAFRGVLFVVIPRWEDSKIVSGQFVARVYLLFRATQACKETFGSFFLLKLFVVISNGQV